MKTRRFFTLIEVVVALAILAISLTGLLELSIVSQERLGKVYEKWRWQHMLMQAAEYYLLHPGEKPGMVPVTVFPYTDYTAECTFRDAENIPDSYKDLEGQLPLRACKIELIRQEDRKTVDFVTVDRINYDDSSSSSSSSDSGSNSNPANSGGGGGGRRGGGQ